MSDLHWACEHCGHHLAIDEKGVGRKVACKSCGQSSVVPPVGSHWFCTECRQKLGAAFNLSGKIVHCDECGAEQKVPHPGKTTSAIKIDLATYSKHAKGGASSSTTVICPQCGAKVPIGATLCSKCMFNLREKVDPSVAPLSKVPRHGAESKAVDSQAWKEKAKIAALLLVIVLFMGRLFADRLPFRRSAGPPMRMLAVEHAEYMRVFDFLQTLQVAMLTGADLEYSFSLLQGARDDLERIGADRAQAQTPQFRQAQEVISMMNDYRRISNAAQQGSSIRGSEAAQLAQRHPILAWLVRGEGASASLDAIAALREMDLALLISLERGIDALSN